MKIENGVLRVMCACVWDLGTFYSLAVLLILIFGGSLDMEVRCNVMNLLKNFFKSKGMMSVEAIKQRQLNTGGSCCCGACEGQMYPISLHMLQVIMEQPHWCAKAHPHRGGDQRELKTKSQIEFVQRVVRLNRSMRWTSVHRQLLMGLFFLVYTKLGT